MKPPPSPPPPPLALATYLPCAITPFLLRHLPPFSPGFKPPVTNMPAQTLLPNQSSLPTPQSTSSYWHQTPSQRLLNHRTTADLPSSSPVIIIGSGITGAFAARELVQAGKDVLILEAREACWGATGRVSQPSASLISNSFSRHTSFRTRKSSN